MKTRLILAACLIVGACNQQGQKKAPLSSVASKTAKFTVNGLTSAELFAQRKKAPPGVTGLTHYRDIRYAYWECDADWNEKCEGDEIIQAPAGWQVCKAVFTIQTSDGHDAWFRADPTAFYPNDGQDPDRYRAVSYTIHAEGNGNIFDHRGSKERVESIGLDLIPADADNFDRYWEGCDMPAHN